MLAWYSFVPPGNSFGLERSAPLALGFYVAIVTVGIAVIHWMQRANESARHERERNRLLA